MKEMTRIMVKFFITPALDFLVSKSVSRIFQKHFKFLISWKKQKDSAFFAAMKSKAARRILKKYGKGYYHGLVKSGDSNTFGCTDVQKMQLMKSACALELMALQINSKESKGETMVIPGLFEQCLLLTSDGSPSLSVTLQDSTVLNIDLTCTICLETVFDPVSLPCNHIYCYMCACSAASVTTVDGLRAANSNRRCPLCRKESVFGNAVRMEELSILLSRKLPEYWEERRHKERKARIQEAKQYWESQYRAFLGIN